MMKYDMLAHLTMLLESRKVFAVTGNLAGFNPGNRIAVPRHVGMSRRQTAEVLLFSDGISHDAGLVVTQGEGAALDTALWTLPRLHSLMTVIDQTKVKEIDWRWYLWVAIDRERRDLLA
jgi:hypothetical protein